MITVRVKLAERSHDIVVGAGASSHLATRLAAAQPFSQVAVIADATVAALHLAKLSESLPKPPLVIEFAPGEASKTLATAELIYSRLAAARFERYDVVLTLGGGVAGDLGGFVAATWQRGVRYIQVPTTVEAAVDASVGGKTAVNLPAGKNLVGAFHQPIAVVIDTDFLATLPQRDFVAGLAESVKHALIRDPTFLAWHEANAEAVLSRDADAIETLIARNCAIKADVVSRDERERNLRAILNYGHTLGHAIEHVAGYELRHGECVALGMIAENEIAVARGLLSREAANRVMSILTRLGLPVRLSRVLPLEDLLVAARQDKKNRAGAVSMVVLRDIGLPERLDAVSEGEIATAARCLGGS